MAWCPSEERLLKPASVLGASTAAKVRYGCSRFSGAWLPWRCGRNCSGEPSTETSRELLDAYLARMREILWRPALVSPSTLS